MHQPADSKPVGVPSEQADQPVSPPAPDVLTAMPRSSVQRRSDIIRGLQGAIGNRAVARLLEDAPAPPKEPAPEVEEAPAPPVLAPFEFDADALGERIEALIARHKLTMKRNAVDALVGVLVPAAKKGSVHETWRLVTGLILTGQLPKDPADVAALPAALTAPDQVQAFGRVDPADRSAIVTELFELLLTTRDKATGAEDASTPEAEWKQLEPIQNLFGFGKLDDYLAVRMNLLSAFGALNDGIPAALARVMDFYTNEMVMAELCGMSTKVHKTMATQLKAAQAKFTAMTKGTPTADFKLTDFGGLNVRPNRNNPSQLSEHAVGAAVDLDAPTDPNKQGFPFGFVEDVTGDDIRKGVTGKGVDLYNVTPAGKPERQIDFETARKEAAHIAEISDELKETFQNEAALKKKLPEIAKRKGAVDVKEDELFDAVQLAATEPNVRWSPPRGKEAPKAPHHHHLKELLFPHGHEDPIIGDYLMAEAIELLERVYLVFVGTFAADDPKRRGKKAQPRGKDDPEDRPRIDPTAIDPALAQFAMHGFMNVAPELAAALVAQDGGNLRWLGAGASALRDFMHFELRRPPKPPAK